MTGPLPTYQTRGQHAALGPMLSPVELVEGGYLQEINRLLLHPLGLALSVAIYDDEGKATLSVTDCRSDPEGIYFADLASEDARAKAERVRAEWNARSAERKRRLGYMVQPILLATDTVDEAEPGAPG